MSESPTAVLISAGAGTRLGGLTLETPKALLEVADGHTMLDCQLAALADAGITRVVMVVGFQARTMMEFVARRAPRVQVDFVINPFYRVTNNLVSVWMALRDLSGDVLAINGDNIFTADAVRRTCHAAGEIVLAVSSKPSYDEDDMKVRLGERGRLVAVSKQLPSETANGESVGMIRYSSTGLDRMRTTLSTMLLDEPAALGQFYLAAIQRLVDAGNEIRTVEIHADSWRELDYPADLDIIRRAIKDGTLANLSFREVVSAP